MPNARLSPAADACIGLYGACQYSDGLCTESDKAEYVRVRERLKRGFTADIVGRTCKARTRGGASKCAPAEFVVVRPIAT